MGQHGRNRTGSAATRGDRVFEAEPDDLPGADEGLVEGYDGEDRRSKAQPVADDRRLNAYEYGAAT